MYIQSVEIENTGPIKYLKLALPFDGQRPKPLVVVGENGTGKSILLSHLVNSLVIGKADHYDDADVEIGKAYKYRSSKYITSGEHYSYSSVKFDAGIEINEIQLNTEKRNFENSNGYAPTNMIWRQMPENETSFFQSNFRNFQEVAEKFFNQCCCLFFPVHRFEEPAWLNAESLKVKANYSDLKHVTRYSNRSIINVSPLKKNRDWILDLIFDRNVFEKSILKLPIPNQPDANPISIFNGFSGQTTNIYNSVIEILKIILRETGNIRLGAGYRKDRQIAVMKDEQVWVPNLFQLSSGETQLLNLFLSIIRDYDLSHSELNNLADIKGIVIIDEIDSNLHTIHQKEVLPRLISSFPNVQFIISTHSPLFLLGMEQGLGMENFEIINLPSGEKLSPSDFSEFDAAYRVFSESRRYREEINKELLQVLKPLLFVEGDYDIRYLRKAAELLGQKNVLEQFQVKDADGFGNLDKIWKIYDNPIASVLHNKLILLYDCDTKKIEGKRGLAYRWTMPTIAAHPIATGIENLFPNDTIARAEEFNPSFIDITHQAVARVRGQETIAPLVKSVNKDEKGNLCDWLCVHGNADDFIAFKAVFEKLGEILDEKA